MLTMNPAVGAARGAKKRKKMLRDKTFHARQTHLP